MEIIMRHGSNALTKIPDQKHVENMTLGLTGLHVFQEVMGITVFKRRMVDTIRSAYNKYDFDEAWNAAIDLVNFENCDKLTPSSLSRDDLMLLKSRIKSIITKDSHGLEDKTNEKEIFFEICVDLLKLELLKLASADASAHIPYILNKFKLLLNRGLFYKKMNMIEKAKLDFFNIINISESSQLKFDDLNQHATYYKFICDACYQLTCLETNWKDLNDLISKNIKYQKSLDEAEQSLRLLLRSYAARPAEVFVLRYNWAKQGGYRPNHPRDSAYNLININHANHHVVPIGDLEYVWDYFHKLEDSLEIKLKEDVTNLAMNRWKESKENSKLKQDLRTQPTTERDRIHKEGQVLKAQFIKKTQEEYRILYKAKLKEVYGEYISLLENLCQPMIIGVNDSKRTFFIWAWWNLFKGWDITFRKDDPREKHDFSSFEHSDSSEKVKLKKFDEKMWNYLKDSKDGLYISIKNLKKAPGNKKAEEALKNVLQSIHNEWSKRKNKEIHPFSADEWEEAGERKNHPIYRVKAP